MSKDSSRPRYVVYLDTDTLRGRDIVSKGLDQFVLKHLNDPRFDIDFRVSEIVYKEWLKNYSAQTKSALRRLRPLLEQSDVILPRDDELEELGHAYFRSLNIQVIPVDYSKINTSELVDNAVKGVPPFKGGSDKDAGFKDGVITQNVMADVLSAGVDEKVNVVCIYRDKTNKSYLKQLATLNSLDVQIYESYQLFDSELNLIANDISLELADEASKIFFEKGNKKSLYYRDELLDRIISDYVAKYPSADEVSKSVEDIESEDSLYHSEALPHMDWEIGRNYLQTSPPVFSRVDDEGRLFWETSVIYTQEYDLTSNQDSPTVLTPVGGVVSHRVEYTVTWSHRLSKRKKVTYPKLEKISAANESLSFKPSYDGPPVVSIGGKTIGSVPTTLKTASGLSTGLVEVDSESLHDMALNARETLGDIGGSIAQAERAIKSIPSTTEILTAAKNGGEATKALDSGLSMNQIKDTLEEATKTAQNLSDLGFDSIRPFLVDPHKAGNRIATDEGDNNVSKLNDSKDQDEKGSD